MKWHRGRENSAGGISERWSPARTSALIWGVGFTSTAAILVAGLIMKEPSRSEAQVVAAAAVDDFEASRVEDAKGDSAHMTLDLGACAIGDVHAQLVAQDGEVTDISRYNISGIIDGQVTEKRTWFLGAPQTVIEGGHEVTYEFSDLAGLQQDLGEDPCATLAAHDFISTTG